jgi:DNA polymerase IV (DinB-like DNA polymerase)
MLFARIDYDRLRRSIILPQSGTFRTEPSQPRGMPSPGDATLPGVDDEPPDQIVLHVDMDCFYAACERLREPKLEGEPLVVGMGYEPGDDIGAVATASYEAREHGIESAQAISTALDRLPRLDEESDEPAEGPAGYYRTVDLEFYQSVAADVKEILHDCADVVREVSIDEAYLDVTDRTAWEVADGFGRHIKNRIEREVGVVASVGIAPTLSAAKVASDRDKPDGLVVVEPGEVAEFFAPLSVEEVHGVGPVTARSLRGMGIETAGDLATADPHALTDAFGDRGRELYDRARGADTRPVTPTGDPKSLSRESAFAEAVEDAERKREQVRALAGAVADRARSRGALYRTIGVKAVTPPYDVNTRERSLPGPIDDPELVERIALEQIAEFDDAAVRKVGVRVSNLEFPSGEQARLSGWDADSGGNNGAGPTDGEGRNESSSGGESGQSSLADFSDRS